MDVYTIEMMRKATEDARALAAKLYGIYNRLFTEGSLDADRVLLARDNALAAQRILENTEWTEEAKR